MIREIIEYEIKSEDIIDTVKNNNEEINLTSIYNALQNSYYDLGHIWDCYLDEDSLLETAQEILKSYDR